MKSICAWCHPGYKPVNGETVTHGICETHKAGMMEELKGRKAAEVRRKIFAALQVTIAVAGAIHELREVPAGILYTHLQDKLSLDVFMNCIRTLKDTGLVVEENHMLKWVGV